MRVLHLTYADPAGVAIFNADALMSVYPDIEVRVIRQRTNYLEYPQDLELNGNLDDWVEWADIIHYHQTGVKPEMISQQHVGQRPTIYHFHHRHYIWHFSKWRKLVETYGYYSVVSTPNLTLLNNDEWLPSPRPDYSHLWEPPVEFTVCQAPTNRKVKSTQEVIQACRRANVKLDIIEGVSYQESLRRKAKANLLIDQFNLGYGLNAIEAWSLGMPSIGNASKEILDRIKELIGDTLFFSVNISELFHEIQSIRDNPSIYSEWQKKGREVYEKFHSYQTVGEKTLGIYEKVLHKKSYRIPFKSDIAISIVIPCFNYSSYLLDAIQSLDRQTFENWEAVIVNDADPKFNVPNWISNHPKVVIIHNKENVGVAEAINIGVKSSTGKYITVLSADDMMKRDRLELLYNTAIANPHQFVYDDITVFGPGTARVRGLQVDNVLPLPNYNFDTVLHKGGMHAGTLYPLAAFIQSGGYPSIAKEGREDQAFTVAMGLKGWCGVHVNKPLYLYRRHSANRTNFDSTPEWNQIYKQRMRDLYPDLYNGNGVLPMGCCGGKGSRNNNNPIQGVARDQASLPGAKDGWTEVEYIGPSSSDFTWSVGYTRYVLGGIRKKGYVANEHLQKMLSMAENGQLLFRIVPKPKPVVAKKAINPVVDIIEEDVAIVSGSATSNENLAMFLPFNPFDKKVSEIKNLLPDLSLEELDTILLSERNGKNRSTVISAIEAQLNAQSV